MMDSQPQETINLIFIPALYSKYLLGLDQYLLTGSLAREGNMEKDKRNIQAFHSILCYL